METTAQTLQRVKALSEYRPVSEKEYLAAIKKALNKVIADLNKIKGKWTRTRMNEIISRLRKELKSPTAKFISNFDDDMLSAIWADYNKGITRIGEEVILYDLSKDVVENILGFTVINFERENAAGKRTSTAIGVDELLKSVEADTVKRVKSTITSGAVTGANPNDIVRQVGAIAGVEQTHLRTVVRTMMADAQNRVHMKHLEDNQDLYTHYEFTAKLDNRTSILCRETDDTIWKTFDAIPLDYYPPLHPNCRSIIVGIVKD